MDCGRASRSDIATLHGHFQKLSFYFDLFYKKNCATLTLLKLQEIIDADRSKTVSDMATMQKFISD